MNAALRQFALLLLCGLIMSAFFPAGSFALQDTAVEEKTEAPQTEATESDAQPVEISPVIKKIIEIGKADSQVQNHLDYLTNRIGPRLTGSEGLQAAGEWARDKFESLGLESRLEQWGEFPVGFERGPSYGRMISPKKMKLEFGTNAWTAGTKGRDLGKAILAPSSMEELEEVRDEINGAYVLMERMQRSRRTRPTPSEPKPEAEEDEEAKPKPLTREERQALYEAILECKPAGIIRATYNELILTGGSYNVDYAALPEIPSISLLKEQYDEIKQMVEDGEEVQLVFDIRNHFRKGPIPLFNVIADIPGTEWPEQVVIVGGHLDSWDGATGATDNGAGCATAIEAARILMAAGAQPKRTIRFMLWSGEEQGLLGSRAYVEKNLKDVKENVSAVFVHDGGTNYVSGIRCTEAMKPDFEQVFAAAMSLDERAPFEIQVIETMRARGGSDHVPFIRAGVPGFFWNQAGRATYRTTHHTQFDTYETVVPEYQQHSAIVIAIGALGTANLDHLLPRDGIE